MKSSVYVLTILLGCLSFAQSFTLAQDDRSSIDFDTQIIPVLTKSGCNAGACHGAAAGRGGLHLSLFGSRPEDDYAAIVTALEGRRVNRARPEQSLVLLKPSGELEHGGDIALAVGTPTERLLRDWLVSGAGRGSKRNLTHFKIVPREVTLHELSERSTLHAFARFDDGPEVDVTPWTVFTSVDADSLVLDEATASLQARRRGQHLVIARFLNRVLPIQITVPLAEQALSHRLESKANFIDEEIDGRLEELGLSPAETTDDLRYLRRVTLDLTGRLPELQTVDNFVKDKHATKRLHLVDRLLSSDEFVEYWTFLIARQLRLHGLPNETAGVAAYSDWIRQQLATDAGWDKMAHELLTATGDSHLIGPANFGRMVGDARAQAELVGELFLGARLGCANCHNHPLDKWTQDDYHGLAAIFARLERGRHVSLASRGAVTNPRTSQPAVARLPGERDLPAECDQLGELSDWLTGSGRMIFARATVNRLWHAMFGRGLVDPVDDMRDTNPASHPRLLDRLARDFIAHDYNLRHSLRLIAMSETYMRAEVVHASDLGNEQFYSSISRRPLSAEVLADAIADVTDVPLQIESGPSGTRAIQLLDPLLSSTSLDALGRCNRGAGCSSPPPANPSMATQLHLINGPLINRALIEPRGRLHTMLKAGSSDGEIIEEFYLRALGCPPTEQELAEWIDRVTATDPSERIRRLEDFLWSLLNSQQFRQNH